MLQQQQASNKEGAFCHMTCISGTDLSRSIVTDIKQRVSQLKNKGITPTLAVLQVGDIPSSTAYINQKKKAGTQVGIEVTHIKFTKWVSYQKIAETIHRLNENNNVHGIVIQQPLPPALSTGSFSTAVALSKDVDGFRLKSPFRQPVARAVMHILSQIFERDQVTRLLKSKKIVIVGRGVTAGKPVAEELADRKIPHIIIHSKTTNKKEFYENADVIISCVGKKNVIPTMYLKQGVILISVGISRNNDSFEGDYDEVKVKDIASFYTPTPGGIGPLTVAFLLDNVVKSAEKSTKA